MFGEYAQIATYLPSSRDVSSAGENNLPTHLMPPPSLSQPLWLGGGAYKKGRSQEVLDDKGFIEDFVMVAEFSEIEGPKPVLTIPKEAGNGVDKNALSVKIMAVDHQTASEGFSISEDTQVVLSDDESGVSAFVHHFVLYDNQARGFVRPYCMVFISPDIRKIMIFYEEISSQFKRAARFLKYGNRLVFVKDLERHLQDLDHTKGYLLNQVSRRRLKETDTGSDSEQNKSRNSTENELYKGLQNIRQSTTEIKDILTVLKPLLHDRRLESRFRALEERAFQQGNDDMNRAENLSLQEDWFADNLYSDISNSSSMGGGSFKDSMASPVSLFKASRSYAPLLVETKKAKRFNSPLRGLHELCSWGAKEGLRKLRCIHEYFKKDAMVLELEKNESRLMEPTNSMVIHGHCVTSNVLAGVLMRGSTLCISEDSSSVLMSGDKLCRWPSIASDDTLESFKSVESYRSMQDEEENASLYSFASNNSSPGVTTSASAQDFISAPTSPMTEEVAFPPPAPPPTNTTATTSPTNHQLSTFLPSECTDDTAQQAVSTTSDSADIASVELPASPDSFSCSGDGNNPTNFSQVSGVHSELNIEAVPMYASINHDDDSMPLEVSTDSVSVERLCDVTSTKEKPAENGMEDEMMESMSSDGPSSVPVAELSSSEGRQSRIAEIFQRQTSATSAGMCNGEIPQPAMSDTSAHRVPSFVPILGSNSGQKMGAATQKGNSPGSSYLSCSLEKSVEGSPPSLDRSKMEFTESFKSFPDSVSQTDSCFDTDPATDAALNSTLTASTPSSDSCLWKPRNGVYTSGDIVSCLGPGRPGQGIHEVMSSYQNLQPVLYSLMTGRTVLVVGPARMEVEVTKIVTALSMFLPDTKRKQLCVVDWMNRPLKVTDLTRIQLAGICRSEKRSMESTIPTAVKQYSTVMDVERRVIVGPPYQGTMVNNVLQQKKSFKTDAEHVAYIHSWLMELSNKAFIFYHSFCLGEAGGLTHVHSVEKHREQYNSTICSLMNRLGVRDHDISIIEYLAEKVKLSQLESYIWGNMEKGTIVHPLTITSRASQTFRC